MSCIDYASFFDRRVVANVGQLLCGEHAKVDGSTEAFASWARPICLDSVPGWEEFDHILGVFVQWRVLIGEESGSGGE